jgi:hypothetical protein
MMSRCAYADQQAAMNGDGFHGSRRYGMAAFLVTVTGAVFTGAGAVTWFARRDGHSWWRAVRRAAVVLILGTYALAMIHLALAAPF